MQVRREERAAADLGKTEQHFRADVRRFIRARGGQRLVEQNDRAAITGGKDVIQAGALLAETAFIDGVAALGGKMRENTAGGAEREFARGREHAELAECRRESDRAGDDALTAAVRACENVDHAALVKGKVVFHARLGDGKCHSGVVQSLRRKSIFICGAQSRRAQGQSLFAQGLHQARCADDKFDLGHDFD